MYGIRMEQEIQYEDIYQKYLTFQVDGQDYGISIEEVVEIIQYQQPTVFPELPAYAKGIINLRGRVVPLIDVSMRLGKEGREHNRRSCIIVARVGELQVGFIVDMVDDVININQDDISSPPAFTADPAGRYITGIGKIEEKMILLLAPSKLLSDDDLNMLGAASS